MLKVDFFSAKPYDKTFFEKGNSSKEFEIRFLETHLGPHSVDMVQEAQAICAFVNDKLNEAVLIRLAEKGVKYIALRCAGFNNINLQVAKQLGIQVSRVPAYSPQAVAEHAMAMILTLNRKTNKAYNRVREQNFSLNGLLGFNLHNKTMGIVGTGKIGKAFLSIAKGFGCGILAYDPFPDKDLLAQGINYVSLDELLSQSRIVSLHCPLSPETHHLINEGNISKMQKGVMLINTSRGGLIDTSAIIHGLKSKQIGALGIDVYEQEEALFFRDLSGSIIDDDKIQRLMSFPNVLITAHQAFFTEEALEEIANSTLESLRKMAQGNLLETAQERLV